MTEFNLSEERQEFWDNIAETLIYLIGYPALKKLKLRIEEQDKEFIRLLKIDMSDGLHTIGFFNERIKRLAGDKLI